MMSTTHGQEEFEICPMYRIRNSELKHFINDVLNNRFETGFCTVHPILKKGYCVVYIDIYDTSIFSVADLGCLKRCLGGIEGTKIPSFLVGRSVPSVFEKGRDSELYETWRMFKKMVKDNQRRIRKDNSIIPKTSIEYRFSIK